MISRSELALFFCKFCLLVGIANSSVSAAVLLSDGASSSAATLSNEAFRCIDLNGISQLDFLTALAASICASTDIRKSDAVTAEQRANKLKSLSTYLPRVEFNANGNRFSKSVNLKNFPDSGYDLGGRNGDLSLTLNWLIYDFGARAASREGALHVLNAALADREYVVRKLIDSTADAYFRAVAARDTLGSAIEAESSAKEGAEIASALVSHGVQSISDKLLAQGAYDQAVLRRIDAESEKNTALAELATSLGLPRDSAIVLTSATRDILGGDLSYLPQTLITELVDNSPRVRYFREEMLAAQSRLEATRAESRPKISLVANSYKSLTPPDESTVAQTINGWSVGLQLKIPIFEGFSHTASVQAASAQFVQKKIDLESAKRDTGGEIWKSAESLRKNHEKVTVARRAVEHAHQAYDAAKLRYRNGVGSILELLKSQSDYGDQQQVYIKVYSEWNIAKVKFATNTGRQDTIFSTESR